MVRHSHLTAEESCKSVGSACTFRRLLLEAEDRALFAAKRRLDRLFRRCQQLLGELGVEVGVLPRRLGQIPRVGKRVGRQDADQRRRGHFRAQVHRAVERAIGTKRLRGSGRRGVVGGRKVTLGGTLARLRRWFALQRRDAPMLRTNHVIDQVAHLPRATRRLLRHLIRAYLREHTLGYVLGALQSFR